MGEVEPAFIQDLEHRPKLTIIEAEGMPLEKHDKVEKASREFFHQPLEDKVKIRRDEVRVSGYHDTEHTKNVRDWKEVFDFTLQKPTVVPASTLPDEKQVVEWHNQWPQYPPQLREACEEYADEVEKLCFKLIELSALSLWLPADAFTCFFKDQTSFVRLNHYAHCPAPELALGVGRHKDDSAFTVVAQDDVGGLQVKRKSDGVWILVKPTPDAFIINVGDIIQVWSNERYESVEHRVMVAFFFNLAHHTIVKPLEELASEENPTRYRPYNWGNFLETTKDNDFKELDVENIQSTISGFQNPLRKSNICGIDNM